MNRIKYKSIFVFVDHEMIDNRFKVPLFKSDVGIIFSSLDRIEKGRIPFTLFKEEVLSKRDNPKEYLKALMNFAQQ